MDIARSGQVESELDAMIRRRDTHRRQTEGERLTEELYKPSVRAWRERQEAEKRSARFDYHRGQADRLRRTMGELVAYHEEAAARLMESENEMESA